MGLGETVEIKTRKLYCMQVFMMSGYTFSVSLMKTFLCLVVVTLQQYFLCAVADVFSIIYNHFSKTVNF